MNESKCRSRSRFVRICVRVAVHCRAALVQRAIAIDTRAIGDGIVQSLAQDLTRRVLRQINDEEARV